MKNIYTIILFALVSFAAAAQTPAVLRGPYLQFPTSSSIKVKWRTDVACNSRVYYGDSPTNLNQYAEDLLDTVNHTVEITGLTPFTDYYYNIGTTTEVIAGGDNNHRFKTSPTIGTVQPIRVWSIGDFGKGNTGEGQTRDSYLAYSQDTHTDVWLWLGDNVYDDGTDQEYQDKVFSGPNGYQDVFTWLPFMPTPGNHDYISVQSIIGGIPPPEHTGPYYDIVDVPTNGEIGGVASGYELYYSFDYGNVHFVSLNSEAGCVLPNPASNDWTGAGGGFLGAPAFTGSPLIDWLHADLQANTQPWVIVYFHQPPYTDGSHDAGAFYEVFMQAMRENIPEIWEQYGVDIVLCGHSHVYERSHLIHGLYDDADTFDPATMLVDGSSGNAAIGEAYKKYTQGTNPNYGTVYVVNGNSGSNESEPGFTHPVMEAEYGCDSCMGSFVMDIHGDTLRGRHVNIFGEIKDDFTIYKIDGVASVEENAVVNNITVYPNPFKSSVKIEYTLNEQSQVVIDLLDINGRRIHEIYRGEQGNGNYTQDFNAEALGLSKGTYTIRLGNGKKTYFRRLVKFE